MSHCCTFNLQKNKKQEKTIHTFVTIFACVNPQFCVIGNTIYTCVTAVVLFNYVSHCVFSTLLLIMLLKTITHHLFVYKTLSNCTVALCALSTIPDKLMIRFYVNFKYNDCLSNNKYDNNIKFWFRFVWCGGGEPLKHICCI